MTFTVGSIMVVLQHKLLIQIIEYGRHTFSKSYAAIVLPCLQIKISIPS